jgi:hypothetical protein
LIPVYCVDEIVCIWIEVDPDSPYQPPEFQPIASFFGLWHEHQRGNHNGLHEFYFEGNYILLLNIFRVRTQHDVQIISYRDKLPDQHDVLSPSQFDSRLIDRAKRKHLDNANVFRADKTGVSCDEVSE